MSTSKDDICNILQNSHITMGDVDENNGDSRYLWGHAWGSNIELDDSFRALNDQHIAVILMHEGQHVHWNKNSGGNSGLDNELNSHMLEAETILRFLSWHYSNVDSKKPAGAIMKTRVKGFLEKKDGKRRVKSEDEIAELVCRNYYDQDYFTDDDKERCRDDYNY